jgi:hypothetical protein
MSEYTPTTAQVRGEYAEDIVPIGVAEAEFDRWLAKVKAEAWDEARSAPPQYLGPDNGHSWDCMGWEDCHCDTYPNPYREVVE